MQSILRRRTERAFHDSVVDLPDAMHKWFNGVGWSWARLVTSERLPSACVPWDCRGVGCEMEFWLEIIFGCCYIVNRMNYISIILLVHMLLLPCREASRNVVIDLIRITWQVPADKSIPISTSPWPEFQEAEK